MDVKEARIILQNSMAHATQISMHNAKLENKKIDVMDVVEMAKQIARQVATIGIKKEGE